MKRIKGTVSGRVQGVYYRKSAEEKAQTLGVVGWIQNTPDGDVEFEVQGEIARVDDFLRWARRGSAASRVDDLDQHEIPTQEGEQAFTTRFHNG